MRSQKQAEVWKCGNNSISVSYSLLAFVTNYFKCKFRFLKEVNPHILDLHSFL